MKPIRRRKKWSRRRKATTLILILIPLLIAIMGAANLWFLLQPRQIEQQLRNFLNNTLSVEFEIGNVEYSFEEGLTVTDLEIRSPDGSGNVIEVHQASLRVRLLRLIQGHIPFDRIELKSPRVMLARDSVGTLTLMNILRSKPDTKREHSLTDLPTIEITDLQIQTSAETVMDLDGEPLVLPRFQLVVGSNLRTFRYSGSFKHRDIRRIHVKGDGNIATSELNVTAEIMGLQLNPKITMRLPQAKEFWEQYQPTGMANCSASLSIRDGKVSNYEGYLELLDGGITLDWLEGKSDSDSPPLVLESLGGRIKVTPSSIETTTPLSGLAWNRPAQLTVCIAHDTGVLGESNLHLILSDVPLSQDTRDFVEERNSDVLPTAFLRVWDALSPTGRVNVDIGVEGDLSQPKKLAVNLTLDFADVEARYEHFRYPVRIDSGSVVLENREFTLKEMKGHVGETLVTIEGTIPAATTGAIDITIRHKNFVIDRRLLDARPDLLETIWQRYKPSGSVDTTIKLTRAEDATDPRDITTTVIIDAVVGDGDESDTDSRARTGVAIEYYDFPYPIDRISGQATLTIHGGRLREILLNGLQGEHRSLDGDHVSKIYMPQGLIDLKEEGADFDLRIKSPALLVDDALLAAIGESGREVLASLDLPERRKLKALIVKVRAELPPAKLEEFDRRVQRIEQEFKPNSRAAVQIDIQRYAGESEVTASITPADEPLLVAYELFPYPLWLSKGSVEVDLLSNSYILHSLETDPTLGPSVFLNGNFDAAQEDGARSILDLDVRIGGGQVGSRKTDGFPLTDPLLVASLPDDLRILVQDLKMTGALSASNFEIDYSYVPGPNGEILHPDIRYHGDLAAHDLSVDCGAEFREINARAGVEGSAADGQDHRFTCNGTIARHKLSRFVIDDLVFRASFGQVHPAIEAGLAGTFASRHPYPRVRTEAGGKDDETSREGRELDPLFEFGAPESDPLLLRLRPGRVHRDLQVYIQEGDLYGGQLEGFVYVGTGELRKDYYAYIKSRNVDLALAAGDVFNAREDEIAGEGGGYVQFWGRTDDENSLQGRGGLALVDAKLAQLPLVTAITQPFSNANETRTINRVEGKFVMTANRFLVARDGDLTIRSANLEFSAQKGSYIDYDQRVDLTLDPEFIGVSVLDLPGIKQIMGALEWVTHVKVVGPLDKPKLAWPAL